eukprot:6176276-Pleurochrysis_carterae.AAC.1
MRRRVWRRRLVLHAMCDGTHDWRARRDKDLDRVKLIASCTSAMGLPRRIAGRHHPDRSVILVQEQWGFVRPTVSWMFVDVRGCIRSRSLRQRGGVRTYVARARLPGVVRVRETVTDRASRAGSCVLE